MKRFVFLALALISTTVLAQSSSRIVLLQGAGEDPRIDPTIPEGWERFTGGGPDGLANACQAGVDRDFQAAGRNNMTVSCRRGLPSFGGMNQAFPAESWRGKRVRFSAELRADNIADIDGKQGVGGLWLRIESNNPAIALMTDNMRNRGVTGSVEWIRAESVADIPQDAGRILIGFWMQGQGQLWVSDIRFEEVGANVPVTVRPAAPQTGPLNLSLGQ